MLDNFYFDKHKKSIKNIFFSECGKYTGVSDSNFISIYDKDRYYLTSIDCSNLIFENRNNSIIQCFCFQKVRDNINIVV